MGIENDLIKREKHSNNITTMHASPPPQKKKGKKKFFKIGPLAKSHFPWHQFLAIKILSKYINIKALWCKKKKK